MSISILLRKAHYYSDWYDSMPESEQQTIIGKWVQQRIGWIAEAIIELEEEERRNSLKPGQHSSK